MSNKTKVILSGELFFVFVYFMGPPVQLYSEPIKTVKETSLFFFFTSSFNGHIDSEGRQRGR